MKRVVIHMPHYPRLHHTKGTVIGVNSNDYYIKYDKPIEFPIGEEEKIYTITTDMISKRHVKPALLYREV